MHARNYLLVIIFCLFPFVPFGFVVNQAYAIGHCCDCGVCKSDCICNGHGYCIWCAAPNPDPETVKATSPTENANEVVEIRGIPGPVLSSATEDMISDIRGSNGRKGLMLKLAEIDKIKYDLKFSCPQAEEEYLQGNRLGLQVKADIKE